jgi:hypothetical protein
MFSISSIRKRYFFRYYLCSTALPLRQSAQWKRSKEKERKKQGNCRIKEKANKSVVRVNGETKAGSRLRQAQADSSLSC